MRLRSTSRGSAGAAGLLRGLTAAALAPATVAAVVAAAVVAAAAVAVVAAAAVAVPARPAAAGSARPGSVLVASSAGGDRLGNPYLGGKGYVNPFWKARADAEPGGSAISNTPTAVWLDRIALIEGTERSSRGPMGLAEHLDAALAQGATYAQFVIYDLPGRDCGALAANGDLGPGGLGWYQSEFIDPIAAIMSRPQYADLRIITIVEPKALTYLVTSTGSRETATVACDTVKANGDYVKGIQYALTKLHAIGNVSAYLDATHHGNIGWPDNFGPTAELMAITARGTAAGFASVAGFVTNTANYSALHEPFLTVTPQTKPSKWIDWNDYTDESTFAAAFREKLIKLGFPTSIGALIDTSRNGWGGPDRPTRASSAVDLNTRVNESRIDRRIHKSNWCNQRGAGLGERPLADPADGIDAYVWIKPPGESDGSSTLVPNDEGMGFDLACDPNHPAAPRSSSTGTGALPDAPIFGAWFSAQFQELLKNAYPPVPPARPVTAGLASPAGPAGPAGGTGAYSGDVPAGGHH